MAASGIFNGKLAVEQGAAEEVYGRPGSQASLQPEEGDDGLILADVGSNMFITGAPNENWDNDDLRNLRQVTLDNFEVIELGEITLAN